MPADGRPTGLIDCNYAEFWAAVQAWGRSPVEVLGNLIPEIEAGLLTVNEARAMIDLPPLPPDSPDTPHVVEAK